MTYKNAGLPEKGDSVMGVLDGKPVRGTVLSVGENGHKFILQSRGFYEPVEKKRRLLKHGGVAHFVQNEVASEDFELVYRHEAPAAAPAPEVKRKAAKK